MTVSREMGPEPRIQDAFLAPLKATLLTLPSSGDVGHPPQEGVLS